MLAHEVLTEDWLADVLQDSLDMDWTSTDGARAIMKALETGLVRLPQAGGQIALVLTPKPPAGGDAGAVRWRERWYGSDPQRGSSIFDEAGNLIAYFGGDEKTHDATTAAVAAHNAALALPAPVVEGERWRHVKRGTVYEVIGYAELQNGNAKGLREGSELAVYRGEDGKLWARERGEFHDGRFAALSEGRSHG
ncbi:hypothetical protein [Sphingomonas carotinifaciens]|uniref:hypothetical protein n=1 Tax=Sphingomonas carotinifaciens TaxID=1166323 RepID=UPI001237638A|nr:hypothetical protein [Sphingomonas carotinifaciens]